MSIIVEGDFIKIKWEDHAILIDTVTNYIFLDGSRLKTTSAEPFNAKYLKKVNRPYPKRLIKTIISRNYIYRVTIGPDGRVFFLQFDKDKFRELRASPKMCWSWWDDKRNKEKLYYEGNLKEPVWRKCYD